MAYNTPPYPGAYYGFSPSPSPGASPAYYPPPPRPATAHRHHARHASAAASPGDAYGFAPRAFSPRYTSTGQYATAAHVSDRRSSRKPRPASFSSCRRHPDSDRAPYGDADEDDHVRRDAPPAAAEYLVLDGVTYRCRGSGPADHRHRRPTKTTYLYRGAARRTDAHDFFQTQPPHYTTSPHPTHFYDGYAHGHHRRSSTASAAAEATPPYDGAPPRHRRKSSSSTPQRPSSTRPASAPPRKPAAPAHPLATEADARRHRIPPGYSLKNWDPSEEPIMLLGSVFDANSLGKWIYDWTVYHHGAATAFSDMAGELWLLLIQLAGKIKRAEECMPRIRKDESREMVDDFIESGDRLTDKLKKLLKACETPMLKAGRKSAKDTPQLGRNAGTEFVDSIFGRDRQLETTEKFMSSMRLWNLRFDANCEEILRRPGQYE